jgi:hypothetical protein
MIADRERNYGGRTVDELGIDMFLSDRISSGGTILRALAAIL